MRRTPWLVMTVLALLVAAYAVDVLLRPGAGARFVEGHRAAMPIALYAHLLGGALALAIGPFQFDAALRARRLAFHRFLGRVYVLAVLTGGLGGLALSTRSFAGTVTHIGFAVLAVLWMSCVLTAWARIRSGDQAGHRRWMIRGYALTFAAVTLRIWLPLELAFGVHYADAYRVVAWLCWIPNLAFAQWWIRRPAPAAA